MSQGKDPRTLRYVIGDGHGKILIETPGRGDSRVPRTRVQYITQSVLWFGALAMETIGDC